MNNNKTDLIVLGAGDHAKVVMATVEAQGKYTIVGLLDDDPSKQGTTVYGREVLGGSELLVDFSERGVTNVIVAVGDNADRASLAKLAVNAGFDLATAIHPTAIILKGSAVGAGSVLLPNAYVGADSILGEGVLLSVGSLVAHDCEVGSWAQFCPGARLGGHVQVGDYSLIGLGASVLPGVSVGRQVVVGANAAVIGEIPDFATAVGVPARVVVGKPR
jgi:sugar O-acyltransferase (sialic acid O-acetyltransferase NeuD family)